MTTKAKNKVHRRPVGKKPTAGTRRGARRVPGPSVTRPSSTGVRGEQPYAKPGRPQPAATDALGGSDGEGLLDAGGMGQ